MRSVRALMVAALVVGVVAALFASRARSGEAMVKSWGLRETLEVRQYTSIEVVALQSGVGRPALEESLAAGYGYQCQLTRSDSGAAVGCQFQPLTDVNVGLGAWTDLGPALKDSVQGSQLWHAVCSAGWVNETNCVVVSDGPRDSWGMGLSQSPLGVAMDSLVVSAGFTGAPNGGAIEAGCISIAKQAREGQEAEASLCVEGHDLCYSLKIKTTRPKVALPSGDSLVTEITTTRAVWKVVVTPRAN